MEQRTSRGDGGESTRIVTPAGRSLELEYFVWGGPPVISLVKRAIEIVGTDLTGRRVLDVGYGHGHMSCLFALLGAQVVGVDTHDAARTEALAQAERWGVSNRVTFSVYSGNPEEIDQAPFDIAFTKSVLLLIDGLEVFLRALSTKLLAHGQVAFIENGFHNSLSILSRRIVHWVRGNQATDYPGVAMYNWHLPVYLSPERIDITRKVFDVRHVLRADSKHWYLIHGFKRTDR
jgi:protein-L-isoaspartate O-methyltransferase